MKKIFIFISFIFFNLSDVFSQRAPPRPLQECRQNLSNAYEEIARLRRDKDHLRTDVHLLTTEIAKKNAEIKRLNQQLNQRSNSNQNNGNTITNNNPRPAQNNSALSNQPLNSSLKNKEKLVELKEELRRIMPARSTIARKVSVFNNHFDTYIINLRATDNDLKFYWKDPNNVKYSSLERLKNSSPEKIVFATNGGIYDPNQNPQGLLVQDGQPQRSINLNKGKGNFFLEPNGVFLITNKGNAKIVTSKEYSTQDLGINTKNATQSGPMLLINGEYHSAFQKNSPNKKLRSGVGIINDHTIVFAISKLGVNFHDFATLFKDGFGCENALYLDGTISRMYCPELNRFDKDGNFGTMIGLVKKQ